MQDIVWRREEARRTAAAACQAAGGAIRASHSSSTGSRQRAVVDMAKRQAAKAEDGMGDIALYNNHQGGIRRVVATMFGDKGTMTTLASRIQTGGGNDGPPTKESGLPLAIFGKDKIALVVYVATYAPGSSYRVKLVVGTARPVAGRKQGNMEDWCFNSKGEVVSGEMLATSFAGLVRSFAAKGTGVGCV